MSLVQRIALRSLIPAWFLCAMQGGVVLGLFSVMHVQAQSKVSASLLVVQNDSTCARVDAWPQWNDFLKFFVQEDGRVIDASTPQRMSTSEGQSYAMFFALVANDRASFQKLWSWTVANLANGDVESHLPAWSWGVRGDGRWGVLDANSASDADLWFAYVLLEAGRLWHQDAYIRNARAMMALIEKSEVDDLPGLGRMLLPAPNGFVENGVQWRINPSYMPIPLLRRLAQEDRKGPWAAIAANVVRLIQATTPKGYVADWVAYRTEAEVSGQPSQEAGKFVADPIHGNKGSYDAIRTYLWSGMTPSDDPDGKVLREVLWGPIDAISKGGVPPETVDVLSGIVQGTGPFGFSAALLPHLKTSGSSDLLQGQLDRVRTSWRVDSNPDGTARDPMEKQPPYYDYVLSLFGTGWLDQRYRFGHSGRVLLEWKKKCP